MRREIGFGVRTLARELRRQVGARTALLGRPEAAHHLRVTVRRVPVVARVDPHLRLAAQQQRVADLVVALLQELDLPYFWLAQPEGQGSVLCLRDGDRQRFADLLGRVAGPAWYADPLDGDGSATGRLTRLAVGHDAGVGEPGLLVWEYVTTGPGSTFVAAEAQALTVFFWRRDAETGSWRSGVRNLAQDELPGPEFRPVAPKGRPGAVRPSSQVDFPVDVVYTWVDGEDDGWLHSKARAARVADEALFTERAHHVSRYSDHDELRYSLRSLEQFAPWVNHVWIVTADQHPAWLRPDDPWVTVVSHRQLWGDEPGLPTFNSHAIETCLHRIPGLAEHFLYLNDDMLLGRPVRPETFFHGNGISKFYWSRAIVNPGTSVTGEIASTTAARNARRLLETALGTTFTRKFFHTAAAVTVSGLRELEAQFPDVISSTRAAAFRTLDDVAMAGSFYLNWAYLTGRAVPGRLRYTYIDPAAPDAASRLRTLARNRTFDTFCVNDGSSEETPEQRRATDRLIRDFFAAYLPVPGSFEVSG